MNDLERFTACMEYESADRRPNHELGVWRQTRALWQEEAPDAVANFKWNWFDEEPAIGLDRREYIDVDYDMMPRFEEEVLEETDRYIIRRNWKGVVTRALKEGMVDGQRMCMDEYIDFPVKRPEDFADIKRRLVAAIPERYPGDLDARVEGWKVREWPLVLGRNCAARGFYWRAREWMGTENLSYAWYDYPALLHEMMEVIADFIIETSRPVLEKISVDYFVFNEDMSMKTGPLLSPNTYREFILPHFKRVCSFLREHGTRYIAVDTDGDPTALIPLLMEGGADTIWPVERASGISPHDWRRKFGRDLRIWGGVDKRVLARGREAIREHLADLIPLIEEGGFIPTVDHTVPPDISWDNFRIYMELKRALLAGDFAKLR
jgi:uroporphyrinogen decarboxylase-like protein